MMRSREKKKIDIESSNKNDEEDPKHKIDNNICSSSLIPRCPLTLSKENLRDKRHRLPQKENFKVLQILLLIISLGCIIHYIIPHGNWISNQVSISTNQDNSDVRQKDNESETVQEVKSKSRMTVLSRQEKWSNQFTRKSRMIPGIIETQYNQQHQMDEDGDCIAQYDWQLESYPTCNLLHEYDMTLFSSSELDIDFNTDDNSDESLLDLLNHGYFRDVWRQKTPKPAMKAHEQVDNGDDELFDMVAIKTLRYEHDFFPFFYERHRRDAMASEHLTKYKSIMDIYGYCGQSALFEYADGGTLEQTVWNSNEPFTPKEKLIIAYQVAQAFDAVHNVDKVGTASIAHADAMAKQFLYVSKDQRFKLNDFNSAEFITWNKKTNEPCPYEVTTRGGRYKSPEEYKDDYVTEKADIYSVGNIFYLLLTSAAPFYEELDDNIVIERIKNGESPTLDWLPDDFLMPLYRAIDRCWNHDPQQRISPFELKQHFEIYFRIVGISLKQDKVRFHKIPQDLLDADYHKE